MANDQAHDIQSSNSSLTETNKDQSIVNTDSNDGNNQKTTDQPITTPSNTTSESTQSNTITSKNQRINKLSKPSVQGYSLSEDDNTTNRQRTGSSSSSSSASDNETSNIPYEILNNEDNDSDNDLSQKQQEPTNQLSS